MARAQIASCQLIFPLCAKLMKQHLHACCHLLMPSIFVVMNELTFDGVLLGDESCFATDAL